MKQPGKAFGSGIAGAAIITLIHESLRRFSPQAPRMERLGMEAIEKILAKTSLPVPKNEKILYSEAMAGDLLGNTAYYSLTGMSKNPWIVGLATGLAAGIGAVTLPKHLGLNEEHANRTPATTIMTIALYTVGGIVAAGVTALLSEDSESTTPKSKVEAIANTKTKRSWNLKS